MINVPLPQRSSPLQNIRCPNMNPQICPECGGTDYSVIDSRLCPEYRRRRYQCGVATCKHRWNTHEQRVLEDTDTDATSEIQSCMAKMASLHKRLAELLSI